MATDTKTAAPCAFTVSQQPCLSEKSHIHLTMAPLRIPSAASLGESPALSGGSTSTGSTVDIIVSQDPKVRDTSLRHFCSSLDDAALLQECRLLDAFRRTSDNLYEKVRACFFLYAIHRFHLHRETGGVGTGGGGAPEQAAPAVIPYGGYKCLLERQFDRAIDIFLRHPPSSAISSALGRAYYHLGFQILADQVRLAVRCHPGNAWMYDVRLPTRAGGDDVLPFAQCRLEPGQVLHEQTPVRMDLSHCGWSDIFFLGMDFPEGARVLNVSIDLAVRSGHGTSTPIAAAAPPIECFLQVLDGPDSAGKLKLTSVDLKAEVELTHVHQVFDFCSDYLGLLRAGIIASGIVPLGLERLTRKDDDGGGGDAPPVPLSTLFDVTVGPGRGLHLTTVVRGIPKGSRLAVSTNLLSSIIAVGMRATGQTRSMVGTLTERNAGWWRQGPFSVNGWAGRGGAGKIPAGSGLGSNSSRASPRLVL